jgi:hypothetical protein
MMDLVRDKIKALGSGTAVSNLDLTTTMESVGALTNSAEGKRRILRAMLQDLQEAEQVARDKIDYYNKNNFSLKGFVPSNAYPQETTLSNGRKVTIKEFAKRYRDKVNPQADFTDVKREWMAQIKGR